MSFFTTIPGILLLCFFGFLLLVFFHDVLQKKHAIQHNFPVIGHIRYWLEKVGPELRQYWVASDKEEMPFNRSERRWIYSTAKKMNNNFGFGTTELLYDAGYPLIKQSTFPFPQDKVECLNDDPSLVPCLKVMGLKHGRKRPYRPPSVVNISAMSFGALSKNAIAALNRGAALAHCYHNTGEGSISPYHLEGADLIWQLGTGYFGARDESGEFSLPELEKKIREHPQVRAIEIKISQGAKPGKGGILPAAKVTAEIARIRGIPRGQDCLSPNSHREFQNARELIRFTERIAEASGLPVGIKSAVGELRFWKDLALQMKRTGGGPDFISIDGSEGGTGAAPLSFSDHVSMPFKTAFARVYTIFKAAGLSRDIVWIGSGRLGFPDRAIVSFAMGCDLIQVAREAMMAIGCIQAQQCHTGHCPAGIATQNAWLQAGINVRNKAERLKNFVEGFRKEILALTHASGYQHPGQYMGEDIEIGLGRNRFETLEKNLGYKKDRLKFTSMGALGDYM